MRLSVRARLNAALLLLVALPLGIVALNLVHAARLAGDATAIDQAGSERERAYLLAALVAEHVRRPRPELRDRLTSELEMWDRVRYGLLEGDAKLGLKPTTDSALRGELQAAGKEIEALRHAIGDVIEGRVSGGAAELDAAASAILAKAFALVDRMDRVTRGLQESSESEVRQFWAFQVALAITLGIVGLAALVVGHRYVLYPLPRFLEAMRAIGAGELRTRVPEAGPVEFVSAARAFNAMGAALEKARAELVGHERELAEKNQELEHASRLKSEFLANMSHELRTPLNAVLGYAALLRRGIYGPLNAEQRDALEGISVTGKHLLELINDVLDLSKIEAGKMTLKVESVDLGALVEELARTTEPLARNKGLEQRCVVEGSGLVVDTDAEKVRRVLINFISNAVKFTKAGHVEVKLAERRAEGEIALSVRDTGIGIPHDDLSHIFEDFRQGDGSASREFGGTGLGLAICLRLARLLGARIEVETALGTGSTFSLVLPREPRPGKGDEVRIHEYAKQ